MTGIDEVILCDNKAKNAGIAVVTARLFNEVNVQKNESKQLGYFFTIPKPQFDYAHCDCQAEGSFSKELLRGKFENQMVLNYLFQQLFNFQNYFFEFVFIKTN